MSERSLTRRRAVLAAGGISVGALAGCSSIVGGDSGGGGDPTGGDGDNPGTATTARSGGFEPLALRTVATGFQAPLDFADVPGRDLRYVADQMGVISTVEPDGDVEPFLDLRDRVVTGGERGLLGLALHPDFAENRRAFVRYSSPRLPGTPTSFDHTFVLSEFEADDDGGRAVPGSERRLLTIPEPQPNHNGGSITFGPDGYLYVGVGDGGGGHDVGIGHVDGGNGQDVTDNLLGSILRIDVDVNDDVDAGDGGRAEPYGIPDDNPLVGEVGLSEHYAWGFRNPWRMSFDDGDLFVGDVGQNEYEEVDVVESGGNYGWNVKEGTHCLEAPSCPDETPDGEPLIDPIVEYPHSDAPVSGVSVIGGYVYRGDDLPGLSGRYVFGDLETRGRLFVGTRPEGDGPWQTSTVDVAEDDREKLRLLLSFGRDEEGRLYVLGRGASGDGGVYELRPSG